MSVFKTHLLHVALLIQSLFMFSACNSPEVIHDLSDASFPMVNQDSATVHFPADFEGRLLVVGFIYTNCPDVCPIITANLKNISTSLGKNEDIHFVEITFDPGRDTPSRLKQYARNFRLDEERFTLLTGSAQAVDSLLASLDIAAEVSYTTTTEEGEETYFMNHTNRILIMDRQGRVRMEYPGSVVPPENVTEDLQTLL